MKHVVIDPITRIEGHLRTEVTVDDGGKVTDAISSGTAWRGLELVMNDRDPRDAWAYIQRICGVCTSAHALASLRSVEDALGIRIPKNANYIRNIMAASLTVQDHLVHFYHLHALDWVSPVEALAADPAAASNLASAVQRSYTMPFLAPNAMNTQAYSHVMPPSTPEYFQSIKNKVKAIVDSGQLGIFAANWWDHPDYKLLPPEVHLLAIAHYLDMLDQHRQLVVPQVIFGGKNPHPHFVVGGVSCAISMNDGNAPINTARLNIVDHAIHVARDLARSVYLPDALAIGSAYVKAGRIDGGGLSKTRVLGFGQYPIEPYSGTKDGGFFQNLLIRCNGVVEDFGKGAEQASYYEISEEDFNSQTVFTESIDHAWYEYPNNVGDALHPWEGVTAPHFTGPKVGTPTDWKELDEAGKYSWLKTPKWRGRLCEVGPLARYIILYTKAKQGVISRPTWAERIMLDQIDLVSKTLGHRPEEWLPTMVGRTAARALDAQLNAEIERFFFDKLIANIKSGDFDTVNNEHWNPETWPKECKGVGLYEAPRGALSHWVAIKNQKVANYQCVVPTTWNACPRDATGAHGAYELAMMDTHVANPEQPLEIVKVVRSFDPCMACATHMYNIKGEKIRVVTTDPISGTHVDA